MALKSINTTTSTPNEEILPTIGGSRYAISYLTMAINQDTNIFINGSKEPVFIQARYGLTIPENMTSINSIIIEKAGTNVYCLFYA